MIEVTIDGATVKLYSIGQDYSPEDSAFRQRYQYEITTPDWQYVDNDIRSGCGADVDEPDMLRTLFSFLSACAESRQYVTRNGGTAENADLFPEHVGQWAEENSDEISMLSIDPAEMDL
jgi:hypothetical protein